jgi:hypothetical protein
LSYAADSELALQYPQLQLGELYVFKGSAGTVLIQVVSRLSFPGGFFPGAQYAFHLDLDGDFRADLTFRVTFGPGRDGVQQADVRRVSQAEAADRDAPGTQVAAGSTGRIIQTPDGVRFWAGPAAEPSWMNDAILAAARECISAGTAFEPLSGLMLPTTNLLFGSNVHAIVLELPRSMLDAPAAGIWATTALRGRGDWMQVDRCALPLVPALFGLNDELAGPGHNGTSPHDDRARYGAAVTAGAARAAKALGTAADPHAHGIRVAAALLPDILPYRPGTKASFSPGGAVSGRGLTADAAEAVLSLVMGTHIPFGLDASSASGALRAVFPYLGVPTAPPSEPVWF